MSDPVLCYVKGNFAYFTTQNLDDQWGDDWDDAPYEHNAGPPYEFNKVDSDRGKDPWTITKVAFDDGFYTPCDGHNNSPYSVDQINCGKAPWLSSWKSDGIDIYAGITLSKFCKLVRKAGGSVYMKVSGRRSGCWKTRCAGVSVSVAKKQKRTSKWRKRGTSNEQAST